ncbi:MAG TPA: N-acetyltransferase [Gaiellaceae bacterium]|nr:N-acetyltransferase [Gaiellaceae bacterium]
MTEKLHRAAGAPEEHADALAPLVHAAAGSYFDWLFGGRDAARAELALWVRRPSSEVWAGRATLLLRDDDVVGAEISLSGAELSGCRKADGLAVLGAATGAGRASLLGRLAAAAGLFAPVDAEEWYLSKLAVAPGTARRGFGSRLLDESLQAATDAGFRRCRVDVEASNESAIALYESRGFRLAHEGAAAGMRYLALAREA